MWPSLFLRKIQTAAPDGLQLFDAKLQKGIDLITDYSGIGTPEMCLHFLCEAFFDLVEGSSIRAADPPLICARAADIDVHCRRVLLAQNGPAAPACVFGQFSERCPQQLLKGIEELLASARASLPQQCSKDVLLAAGQDFIRAGVRLMKTDLTVEQCWCHRHQRVCPALPAAGCGFPFTGNSRGELPGLERDGQSDDVAGRHGPALFSCGFGNGIFGKNTSSWLNARSR